MVFSSLCTTRGSTEILSLNVCLFLRVCAPGEDDASEQFSQHTPKLHTFPPSPLSPLTSLQVSVRHLPRLKRVPIQLLPSHNITAATTSSSRDYDIVSKFRNLSLSKSAERLKDLSVIRRSCSTENGQSDPASISRSAECLKDLVTSGAPVNQSRNRLLSKSAERVRELSTRSRVVTPPHLTREPPSPRTLSPHSPHTPSSSSYHSLTPSPHHHLSHLHHHASSTSDTFPFSPPQPSPMSPKLLAGLGEPLQYHSLLDRASLGNSSLDNSSSLSNGKVNFEVSGCSSECSCHGLEMGSNRGESGEHYCSGSFCFDSLCVREGGCEGWREGEGRRGKEGKKAEVVVKRGAVRSPAASSPVRFIHSSLLHMIQYVLCTYAHTYMYVYCKCSCLTW